MFLVLVPYLQGCTVPSDGRYRRRKNLGCAIIVAVARQGQGTTTDRGRAQQMRPDYQYGSLGCFLPPNPLRRFSIRNEDQQWPRTPRHPNPCETRVDII